MRSHSLLRIAVTVALAAAPSLVAAQTVYNTGVDNSGNALAAGTLDPHYKLNSYNIGSNSSDPSSIPMTATTSGVNDQVTTEQYGYGVPADAHSQWVWSSLDSQSGPDFTGAFRTTFDLTGFDPSTTTLSGKWTVDDCVLDVFLNGHSTGASACGHSSLQAFNINQYFVQGTNTLDFIAQNTGGPAGLLVRDLTLTASPSSGVSTVPEPSSMALLGTGLIGLVPMMRRRRNSA